jgi:hypothetical protein
MLQKTKILHKTLGPRMAPRSKSNPEGALLLDAALKNLVAMANRRPEFLRPCVTVL